MLSEAGFLIGEAIAGLASEALPERVIILIAMTAEALLALVIIGGSKRHIEAIYNREQ